MVRRLQHAEVGSLRNQPTVICKKLRVGTCRNRRCDVGGAEAFEGVVDIAGLGLEVIAAGDVADAGFDGKLAGTLAVAVVEDVDVGAVGRPVNVERGEGGVAHDAEGSL